MLDEKMRFFAVCKCHIEMLVNNTVACNDAGEKKTSNGGSNGGNASPVKKQKASSSFGLPLADLFQSHSQSLQTSLVNFISGFVSRAVHHALPIFQSDMVEFFRNDDGSPEFAS
ncbi:hypothetical protein Fot_11237 [Forsythia ovata]|uniref:Uncharacterized protein n=1 Tax=Forsythia ovata TaxID=205694 RepID=A0ABD1WJI8_9LAMI